MQKAGGMTRMSKEMQECVEACLACHNICEETMSYCLQQGGKHVDAQLMRTMMDCTDLTRICADMLMRRSPMSGEMCKLCAQACDLCAQACAAMPDDQQLMRCAESCRKCAEMCRAMAGARA
jgi:hypothetical protein